MSIMEKEVIKRLEDNLRQAKKEIEKTQNVQEEDDEINTDEIRSYLELALEEVDQLEIIYHNPDESNLEEFLV